MKRKLTRRELAAGVVAGPALLGAVAASPARAAEKDPLAAARKQLGETCRKLARFKLSMSAQPAFIFKP